MKDKVSPRMGFQRLENTGRFILIIIAFLVDGEWVTDTVHKFVYCLQLDLNALFRNIDSQELRCFLNRLKTHS